MSWIADGLEAEAARSGSATLAGRLRRYATAIRARRAPWETDLIARLCVSAALYTELHCDRAFPNLDPIDVIATWAEEGGGFRLVSRRNDNGTNDFGPIQINSVHGQSIDFRLSFISSISYWRDTLAPRRLKAGQHALGDFKAFTEGRYLAKKPYAAEAWRIVSAPHPKYQPILGLT